jgi:putative ABC transport system substrate-binding protein
MLSASWPQSLLLELRSTIFSAVTCKTPEHQQAGPRPDFTDNSLFGLAGAIIARALEARVPTVGSFAATFNRPEAGGLYAYGRDPQEGFYGVARLLKKILDGASPADIPFEQPTKFNLLINLKTAKLLGIEIPPALLATANQVIE